MATLLVLYRTPDDDAAFDRHYFSTHVALARKIPGLRRYEVSDGPIATPQGDAPYHLVATLGFDSLDAIRQALGSPEGQATAADLGNFAQAGVELLMFDSREA
jgi:uncharacterized protein (TIGR02118 family)